MTGASWQSAAASVADSLERGAAKQVGALQPKPQTYMTDSGLLRVTFEGSPLALAWRLRGDPVARPDAIALIAQCMEARSIYAMGDSVMGRHYYCELGAFRPPMAGEYYLSGAIPEIWWAPNDLSKAFRIVRPTHCARQVTAWQRGDAFEPPALRRACAHDWQIDTPCALVDTCKLCGEQRA